MPDPTGRISHLPDMHRGVSWKQPVRCASTANVTLASAVENGDTLDGITLATGDRILLKDQSTGSQNGIYVVAASGAPTRAFDMDQDASTSVPAEEVMGAFVYVIAGTTNGGKLFRNTNTSAPTIGSTSLTFTEYASGVDLSAIDFLVGTATGLLSAEIAVGTTPGGELGGTWASPTVDAVHSGSAHLALGTTSTTAAAGDHTHASSGSGGDHEHMIDVFSGDGSTTTFELTDEPVDAEQVYAFVAGSWTAVTVSGGMSTTATFAVAPASGTSNVVIQYPAVSA